MSGDNSTELICVTAGTKTGTNVGDSRKVGAIPMTGKERHMKSSKKKAAVKAVCRECGKEHYSKTTNKGGLIVCVNCDKELNKATKEE